MHSQWSYGCVRVAARHNAISLASVNNQRHYQHNIQLIRLYTRASTLPGTQVTNRYTRPSTHSTRAATTRQASTAIKADEANPPASTRSPFLDTPERGTQSLPAYLWKLARAYGGFYKTGVKAIFSNRKLAQEVQEQLKKSTSLQQSNGFGNSVLLKTAFAQGKLTRSDYQLLRRNSHDMMRVPLFGVLVLVFGEWLPLLMVFTPYLPPLTCRISSQVTGMRVKTEERRRWSFRQGTQEPDYKQIKESNSMAISQSLTQNQLYHLACTLNLHGRFWERLQTAPPSTMIRRRLVRRLEYLSTDDKLLAKAGGARALGPEELLIACEERGMDVLGPSEDQLRSQLSNWLQKQAKADAGPAVLGMLFRRPNAWK